MVFNSNGAIFFPVNKEHRDQKSDRISYEDNYKGNALAAMLTPDKIEIRFHQEYSDTEVALIISALKQQPDMCFLKNWEVTYQGRSLVC